MTAQLPSWPTTPPTYGSVVLREFTDEDAHLAVELGDDPYIPLIGSLPAHPTASRRWSGSTGSAAGSPKEPDCRS